MLNPQKSNKNLNNSGRALYRTMSQCLNNNVCKKENF